MVLPVEKKNVIRKETRVEGGPESFLRFMACLIRRGNRSRIVVREGRSVLAEFPVTTGLLAGIIAPWFALMVAMVFLAGPWSIEVVRPPRE
ncbi:MAG TPA: DUF4342 domain-containing protein [Firmicutes bacterium]|nr:DUF4342 domain-containing protein [Candidatus Fermentithermobacillaceae bacterium]